MNRKHNRDDYFRIIERVREARPDIALSSDFIVGFPGESEDDFRDTMDLIDKIGFAQCYSFKYSKRPGTPGAELDDLTPESVKDERLQELQKLLDRQAKDHLAQSIGQTMDILVEKPARKFGQLVGRSPYLQSVHIMATSDLIGSVVPVRITSTGTYSLNGEIADQASPSAMEVRG